MEEGNRLKIDSIGTTFTFKEKYGNSVRSGEFDYERDNDQERSNDPTTDINSRKHNLSKL